MNVERPIKRIKKTEAQKLLRNRKAIYKALIQDKDAYLPELSDKSLTLEYRSFSL
jgi:hypothetical protein